jgi:hypothetical protein
MDIDNRSDDVAAAFDAVAEETPEVEPVAVETAEPVEAAPVEAVESVESAEAKAIRARDETGKFTKAAKAAATTATKAPKAVVPTQTAAPVPGDATATPQPPPATQTETLKAPQSLKPAARELWAKVPVEVQAEVVRREKEIAVALQQSAAKTKVHDQLEQIVRPYEHMIRAEGGDVFGTINSLLQTAAALRTAPPAHKGQLIASLIDQFGVDLQHINAAWEGKGPQQQQQPQQSADPRFIAHQVRQEVMRDLQRERQQVHVQKAQQDVETFGQSKEFFDDVKDDVADFLESAAKRGLRMSLEDAYARACALHPEVSRVLEQRRAAEQANTATVSTQRAIRAGSSVKSQPATAVTSDGPTSRRGDIEAAFGKLSGR